MGMGNLHKTVPSHSQQAIPIPIPVKLELLFPFPWDSHGTHGNSQHSLTSTWHDVVLVSQSQNRWYLPPPNGVPFSRLSVCLLSRLLNRLLTNVDGYVRPLGSRTKRLGFDASGGFKVGGGQWAAAPIHLTNFCINVKCNARMHQTKPYLFQIKIHFFLGRFPGPPRPSASLWNSGSATVDTDPERSGYGLSVNFYRILDHFCSIFQIVRYVICDISGPCTLWFMDPEFVDRPILWQLWLFHAKYRHYHNDTATNFYIGTCESEIFVRIEFRIESGCSL